MRLYEVEDVVPGLSIRLHDLVDGAEVTVSERALSRQADRGDAFALRIVHAGYSGKPEIDLSAVHVPGLVREALRTNLVEARDALRQEFPGATDATFWKWCAPQIIHDHWMGSVLDPVLPRMQNTDGEDLVLTRVRFAVTDGPGLERALASIPGVEANEPGRWSWVTTDERPNPVSLGLFRLVDGELHLECNSVARGERGRALVEGAAGDALRFLAASHEDPTEMLRERMRNAIPERDPPPDGPPDIPPEVLEELTLTHLARHYREWVDYPVPALGGLTPRAASRRPDLVPELVSLVRGIEGQYQTALRRGEPAYDPSWMWEELGLAAPVPPGPIPAAHDRIDAKWPGIGVLARQVAHRLRERPGFDDRTTRCRPGDLEDDLAVQRFVREHPEARPALPWLVDYELHRRKTFAVDRALAWMLLRTELDAAPDEIRLPFVSFAVVFTDRAVLSFGERWIAATRSSSPIAGHFARVLTAFVSGTSDALELRFVVDALGADPPELVEHVVPLGSVRVRGVPAEGTPAPLQGLVHAVVSAVLYATSPGAPPRDAPSSGAPARANRSGDIDVPVSDEVFHLPGTIDISRLRQLESLERVQTGRKLLHRFLVRGHWRRPAKSYKDQRPRWIEPYWKGPDLAAVVEKAYRLVP